MNKTKKIIPRGGYGVLDCVCMRAAMGKLSSKACGSRSKALCCSCSLLIPWAREAKGAMMGDVC